MKSKELREWYQSGISLYDIEILMMYDLNDSDLRGYFTLIRDNGVSVNDDTSRLPDELAFEDTETAILLKRRVITKVMGIIRESKQKRPKFKHWNRLALEQKKDKTKGIFPDLELMPEVENLTPEEAEKAYQKWRKKEKPKYINV